MTTCRSKPRVLAVLPGVIPSTTLCVIKPLLRLHRAGRIHTDLRPEYWVSRELVASADVVVFCRNLEPMHSQALEWARRANKPTIYDLDDDLLDVPAELDVSHYHQDPGRRAQLEEYLRSASLVRVYSSHLAKKLKPVREQVAIVDGPIDWQLVPPRREAAARKSPLRIVYATSRQNDHLSSLFADAIRDLVGARARDVELFLWGSRSNALAGSPAVHYIPYESSYDKFFKKFAAERFDIGLAPLPDSDFYLGKSNNKFREYAACGIAGVYSNVSVYSDCVTEGETGLLVRNERGAWFDAIRRLIEDDELRTGIQVRAHAYARARFGMEQFCEVWYGQIVGVLAAAPTVTAPVGLAVPGRDSEAADHTPAPSRLSSRVGELASRALKLAAGFSQYLARNGPAATWAAMRRAWGDVSLLARK